MKLFSMMETFKKKNPYRRLKKEFYVFLLSKKKNNSDLLNFGES